MDDEQAVIIWVKLSDDTWGSAKESTAIQAIEELLDQSITPDIGEYDGHEKALGWFTMYLYGPNADRLWRLASNLIAEWPKGSYVVKRYGPPGATEVRLDLA
ncbi:MAG: hypothetical protein M0Z66_13590 [Thermaerobacter sp.]|nr:hypothetical protein [Thermaerobacter sp.]